MQKFRIINNWHNYLQSALYIRDLKGTLNDHKRVTACISLTMQRFGHIS